MPSLAACIGADIAVLTRDMATGDMQQRPHVYLARPAEGTGAVVQVPQHWRMLAGRLGQQPRASGSGDVPVAPLRVVMFDGHFDAASALPFFRNSSATWTGGMVIMAWLTDSGNNGSHRGPETRLGTSQPDDPP
jgi:hypothetical protein